MSVAYCAGKWHTFLFVILRKFVWPKNSRKCTKYKVKDKRFKQKKTPYLIGSLQVQCIVKSSNDRAANWEATAEFGKLRSWISPLHRNCIAICSLVTIFCARREEWKINIANEVVKKTRGRKWKRPATKENKNATLFGLNGFSSDEAAVNIVERLEKI